MPRRLNLPDNASVAIPASDGRMNAPSAERNAGPIRGLLERYAPPRGRALELASGTGQHAARFAAALPGLDWQPTEPDPDRRRSIDAWAAFENLPNMRPAAALDATAEGWSRSFGGYDLVLLVNLLHLISTGEARALITESARALAPGGRFIFYGPFLRGGKATSAGDAAFHANLTAQDPEIGYKDDSDVKEWILAAGLGLIAVIEMPANNLVFVTERLT